MTGRVRYNNNNKRGGFNGNNGNNGNNVNNVNNGVKLQRYNNNKRYQPQKNQKLQNNQIPKPNNPLNMDRTPNSHPNIPQMPQTHIPKPVTNNTNTSSLLANLKAKVNQKKVASMPKANLQPNGIPKPPAPQQPNKLFSANTSEISGQAKYDQMRHLQQQNQQFVPINSSNNLNFYPQNVAMNFLPVQPQPPRVQLLDDLIPNINKPNPVIAVNIVPAAPQKVCTLDQEKKISVGKVNSAKGSPEIKKKNSLEVPEVAGNDEAISTNGSLKSGNAKSLNSENASKRSHTQRSENLDCTTRSPKELSIKFPNEAMRIAFYKKIQEREDQQRKIQEEEIKATQKKAKSIAAEVASPKNSVDMFEASEDSLGKRKISNLVIDNEILPEDCVNGIFTSGSKQLKTDCGVSPSFTRDTSIVETLKKSNFLNLQRQNQNSYASLGDQKSKMR